MEAQTCTRIQSHHYFHWSHTERSNVRQKHTSLGPQGCCTGDSDRPAHMYSLINTFTGHTQKVATSDKTYILQSTRFLQWRFRKACTNVQSHQYLHWSHTESSNVRQKLISYNPLGCCNGDSDRPAQMYSLINTFTGHTQKVAMSDKTLHLQTHWVATNASLKNDSLPTG